MSERETAKRDEPRMVPFALAGMAIWAVLGVASWLGGRVGWAQICLAGVLWGVPGLLVMIRHDSVRS